MTQVFTDEQKKISAEVRSALNHALKMAENLPKSDHYRRMANIITTAATAMDQAERAVVAEFHIMQRANGSWEIETCFDDDGVSHLGFGDLTAAGVLGEITRMVVDLCPELDEPTTGAQQATDAECMTRCDGPENAEWRRARAMEMAISANQGRHIDAVIQAAGQIEIFLKQGA